MNTKSSRCTFPIILCTAIALLALASLGCEAEDACYQFCIETLACDHEIEDADYQDLLDESKNASNLMKTLSAIYLAETTLGEQRIKKLMSKELELTTDQCIKFGLVTGLFPPPCQTAV